MHRYSLMGDSSSGLPPPGRDGGMVSQRPKTALPTSPAGPHVTKQSRTTPRGLIQELRHFMSSRKDLFTDYFMQARSGAPPPGLRSEQVVNSALRKRHVSFLVQRCVPAASKEDIRYVNLLMEAALPQHAAVTLQDLSYALKQGAKIERLVADGQLPGSVRELVGHCAAGLATPGAYRDRAMRAFADLDLGSTGRLSAPEQVALLRVLEPAMARVEQLWLSAALFWHAHAVAAGAPRGSTLDELAAALAYLQRHRSAGPAADAAMARRRRSSVSAADLAQAPPHPSLNGEGVYSGRAGYSRQWGERPPPPVRRRHPSPPPVPGHHAHFSDDPRNYEDRAAARQGYGYPQRGPPHFPDHSSMTPHGPHGRGWPSPPARMGALTGPYDGSGIRDGSGYGRGPVGAYGPGKYGGPHHGMYDAAPPFAGRYGGPHHGMYDTAPPFAGGTLRMPTAMGFSVTDTFLAAQQARQEPLDPREQEAGHAYYTWLQAQRGKVLHQWFNHDHDLKVKAYKEQCAKLEMQKALKAEAAMQTKEIRNMEIEMAKLAFQAESNHLWELMGQAPVSRVPTHQLSDRILKTFSDATDTTRSKELPLLGLEPRGAYTTAACGGDQGGLRTAAGTAAGTAPGTAASNPSSTAPGTAAGTAAGTAPEMAAGTSAGTAPGTVLGTATDAASLTAAGKAAGTAAEAVAGMAAEVATHTAPSAAASTAAGAATGMVTGPAPGTTAAGIADPGLSLDDMLSRLTSPNWMERMRLPRNIETLKVALAVRSSLMELERKHQHEKLIKDVELQSVQLQVEEARHQMAMQQQALHAQLAMQATELQHRLMYDSQVASQKQAFAMQQQYTQQYTQPYEQEQADDETAASEATDGAAAAAARGSPKRRRSGATASQSHRTSADVQGGAAPKGSPRSTAAARPSSSSWAPSGANAGGAPYYAASFGAQPGSPAAPPYGAAAHFGAVPPFGQPSFLTSMAPYNAPPRGVMQTPVAPTVTGKYGMYASPPPMAPTTNSALVASPLCD